MSPVSLWSSFSLGETVVLYRQLGPGSELLASVSNLKPLLKLGYNKTGAEIKRYLRVSNATI